MATANATSGSPGALGAPDQGVNTSLRDPGNACNLTLLQGSSCVSNYATGGPHAGSASQGEANGHG